MRGKFRLNVLEILEYAAYTTEEIMSAVLTDYHSSYKKLRGIPSYQEKKPKHSNLSMEQWEQKEKQRYQDLLSRLEKQGLVKRVQSGRSRPWEITKDGKTATRRLRSKIENSLPSSALYNSQKANTLLLFAFDVPEKEKRKREWLRAILPNLGLKKLQKSVWLGKVALPKNFLSDLKKLGMLKYVEIFAITKTGTIKHVR